MPLRISGFTRRAAQAAHAGSLEDKMRFIAIGTFLMGLMIFTQVDWANSQPAGKANPPGIASPNGEQLSKAGANSKEPTGDRGEGRKGVRPEKVRSFMDKFTEYLNDVDEKMEWTKSLPPSFHDAFDLSEEESLKLMEEIGGVDGFKASILNKADEAGRNNFFKRVRVFMTIRNKVLADWKTQFKTEEDLIVKKMLPAMERSAGYAQYDLINEIGDYTARVVNHKLHLSEKNRNTLADALFAVFASDSRPLDNRLAAVEAWIPVEIRDDKKRAAFEIISRDVEVFEKRAFHMLSLNRASSPAPWIYDRMFGIIETREKHNPRVVKGAIDFCWGMMSGCGEFGGLAGCPQKLERLKQALSKSLTHKPAPEFKKEYDELREAVAEAEKFHEERESRQKMEGK